MDSLSNHAILLLSCPDKKGIVASVSQFIYEHNGNIVHADQYTDTEKGQFFMRIEWELDDFDLERKEIPEILLRHSSGEILANIKLIISNHPDLRPVAETFGIPFYFFPITPETKSDIEKQELAVLKKHHIDLVILARYMQILTSEFIAHYPNRIINIHHSFLPAFVGSRPYHQARERGVKIIGATSVSHRDSVEDLIRKGRDIEKLVLARAIKLHLENRILVYENKTIIFDT